MMVMQRVLMCVLVCLSVATCDSLDPRCEGLIEPELDAFVSFVAAQGNRWDSLLDHDSDQYAIVFARIGDQFFIRRNSSELLVSTIGQEWPVRQEVYTFPRHGGVGLDGLLAGVDEYIEMKHAELSLGADGSIASLAEIDRIVSERRASGRPFLSVLPMVCTLTLGADQVAARNTRLGRERIKALRDQIARQLESEFRYYGWNYSSIDETKIAVPTRLQTSVQGVFQSKDSRVGVRTFSSLCDLRSTPILYELRVDSARPEAVELLTEFELDLTSTE